MQIGDKIKRRKQQQRNELRRKIMDAARELFASQGFEQVSMRKIAEAISYSPTAIYLHFADKDTLMREICREDFGRLAKEFNKIGMIQDPAEQIRATGRAYIKFGVSNPNHYRLMFMTQHPVEPEPRDFADFDDPSKDGYAFLRMCVERLIALGRVRQKYANAELVSQTLWASVHGMTSLAITYSSCPWIKLCPLSQRIDAIVNSTLDGLMLPERSRK